MAAQYLDELQQRLLMFAKERDWEQFHAPKNLAMALAVEAGATLMIHRPQLVDTANKHRIALLGISGTALHATGAG